MLKKIKQTFEFLKNLTTPIGAIRIKKKSTGKYHFQVFGEIPYEWKNGVFTGEYWHTLTLSFKDSTIFKKKFAIFDEPTEAKKFRSYYEQNIKGNYNG
jgi:hypothetical protein